MIESIKEKKKEKFGSMSEVLKDKVKIFTK
jgi:hypothetical protein